MRLAAKTHIALRLLLHLSREGTGDRRVQGRELAARQQLNDAYLEQIMIPLRQANLVQTVRGRHGGYQLAREPERITLLEIIEIFEGALDLSAELTVSSLGGPAREVPVSDQVWAELSRHLREWLSAVTLQSLVERERTGLSFSI